MNKPWSCYLDAIVKATGLNEQELLVDIGHDGSEVIYPYLDSPYCYKGFCPDHLALILLRHGWGVVSIKVPIQYRDTEGKVFNPPEAINWRDEVIGQYPVILLSSNHALGFGLGEDVIVPEDFHILFIQVLVTQVAPTP